MGLYFIVRGEVEFMLEDNLPIFKKGVYILKETPITYYISQGNLLEGFHS